MEATTTSAIEVARIAADDLGQAFNPQKNVKHVYLLGSLSARGVRSDPPAIISTGESVILNYAKPEVVIDWGDRILRNVSLSALVRHAPGIQIPPIQMPVAVKEADIDPELKRWLGRS